MDPGSLAAVSVPWEAPRLEVPSALAHICRVHSQDVTVPAVPTSGMGAYRPPEGPTLPALVLSEQNKQA